MTESLEHATRPIVGGTAWERAGGPPLSIVERLALLGGTAFVLLRDLQERTRFALSSRLVPVPAKIDLEAWALPDTPVVRAAEEHLRATSSPAMVSHCYRSYYFSAVRYAQRTDPPPIDREVLAAAILLHDTGLFEEEPPAGQRCFTVAGARDLRKIATAAGWDEERQDRGAAAITANLNAFVSIERFGVEAHFFSEGGVVEILAQGWKIHPDNLAEILARHPREGFGLDAIPRVRREAKRNPGCRFACFGPLFPAMLAIRRFAGEAPHKIL